MGAIEAAERRALIPISRIYIAVLGIMALATLIISGGGALIFHMQSQVSQAPTGAPSVASAELQQRLRPASPPAPMAAQEAAERPSRPAPGEGVKTPAEPTPLQAALIGFALAVDPDKRLEYFNAYEAASLSTVRCAGAWSLDYARALTTQYAQVSKALAPNAVPHNIFLAEFCRAWEGAITAREYQGRIAVIEAAQAADRRNLAAMIAVGSLGALTLLALPLALFAIERNTRAVEQLVRAQMASRATAASMLIAFTATLMLGSTFPHSAAAQVQIETEQQRREREQRETIARADAAVARQLESRKQHVGKSYVFNPAGNPPGDRWSREEIWFYRTMINLLDIGTYLERPKVRFLPKDITRFDVEGVVSIDCSAKYSRDKATCYFYAVKIGGMTAYLPAGNRENSFSTSLKGFDPLSAVSFNEQDMILAGMPNELATARRKAEEERRRLAEERAEQQRREAADRAERQKREAAERAERERRLAEERAAAERERREAERLAQLERRRSQLAERFPPEIVQAIFDGRIEPGWSDTMVLESWGEADKVKTVPPGDMLWLYDEGRYVTFQNGNAVHVFDGKGR